MRALAGLLVLACLGCGSEPTPTPTPAPPAPTASPPRNAILIVIDGLRPDAISMGSAPAIAGLAAEGVSLQARSTSAWCKPSAASLLTSLAPDRHGTRSDSDMLPRIVWTLAEVLRCDGFATAAFSSNGFVSARFRFDQGFDHFDRGRGGRAAELLGSAARWIAEHGKEQRFFAYVHIVDVLQYDPPAPFAPPGDELVPQPRAWIEEVNARRRVPTERETQHVRDLYAGQVRSVDAALRTFLAELDRLEVAGSTVIVLTADHATALGEDGWFGHPEEPALHGVPLIVRGPVSIPEREVVDHVDVAPTLLELLEVGLPARFEGRSFGPRAIAPPPGPTVSYPRLDQVFTREECDVLMYNQHCDRLPSEAELTDATVDTAPCALTATSAAAGADR